MKVAPLLAVVAVILVAIATFWFVSTGSPVITRPQVTIATNSWTCSGNVVTVVARVTSAADQNTNVTITFKVFDNNTGSVYQTTGAYVMPPHVILLISGYVTIGGYAGSPPASCDDGLRAIAFLGTGQGVL